MSLQELKDRLIESIAESQDEAKLEELYTSIRSVKEPDADYLFELARRGREQIEQGRFGTLADLNKALGEAILRGRSARK